MTTITIERELLEQALANMVRAELLYGQPNQAIQEAIRAALSAPATAPEPMAWMSPKRFYRTRAMALTNGEQLIEPLYLHPPATAPERKPMHEGEIQAAWLGQDLDEPIPYSFVLGIRSAERFNGIKETP